MEPRSYAFITGLFIILFSVGLFFVARWVDTPDVVRIHYQVVSEGSVSGLSPYSKVYFRGVEVGQATQIAFASDGSRSILIDIELETFVPVTINTYAMLKQQGLTGIAQIELLDDGPSDAPRLASSPDHPVRITMRPSLLESLQNVGQGIAEQVQQLTINLNQMFTEEKRDRVDQIMHNIELSTGSLYEMTQEIKPAIETVPRLGEEAQKSLASLDTTLKSAEQTLKNADTLARESTEVSKSLLQISNNFLNQTLPEINQAVAQLTTAAEAVTRASEELSQDPPALLLGRQRPPPGPGEPGHQRSQ